MHRDASLLLAVESDLLLAGWDRATEPYPGQSGEQFALMSLARSIVKKFHNNEQDCARDEAALAKFIEMNNRCSAYQVWKTSLSTAETVAWGESKLFLDSFFRPMSVDSTPTLCFEEIKKHISVGRGANIGGRSSSFYGKIACSKMATTSEDLYNTYVQMIQYDPIASHCEAVRDINHGHLVINGSRLSFAPKSAKISRTICTEPLLNMLLQKGIAGCLEKRLKQVVGIDLSTQPDKNRRLCRIGSVSGRFGTIDLSSASDSMSMTLLRELLPPQVVRWLEYVRCERTTLPGGKSIDLHMVSSMGNGFTFPLQTIIFTAIVLGVYKARGITPIVPKQTDRGNFAVFGDDIIVLQSCYDMVVNMLEFAGFVVNKDKSFNSGLFRESCGHDYYDGYNVRGVYIQKLLNDGDCYSAINRLNRWSARHGVGLPSAVTYLLGLCSKLLYVPYEEDDSAGIKVPMSMALRYLRQKPGYYRALVPRTLEAQIDDSASLTPSQSRRLQRLIPGYFYNPDGVLLSFLHGSIRRGYVGFRAESLRTVTRLRYTPRWDYIVVDPFERGDWGVCWKVFTLSNLYWFDKVN